MAAIAVDLGGTKIECAIYNPDGTEGKRLRRKLDGRTGGDVAALAIDLIKEVKNLANADGIDVDCIGICVPGIVRKRDGAVWAPNIPGWDYYPLQEELQAAFPGFRVGVDSDRSCAIYGSTWVGAAANCENAVFFAVGTGIGLGVKIDGHVIHGHGDIAGAIGWLGLEGPYDHKFDRCGCFEYYASGTGIGERAQDLLRAEGFNGDFGGATSIDEVRAENVFAAYDAGHPVAVEVLKKAILMWGMASANIVSIFNPERVIWGGGVFGPGRRFIEEIKAEARKWAQPIAINQVEFLPARADYNPILSGAAYIAFNN